MDLKPFVQSVMKSFKKREPVDVLSEQNESPTSLSGVKRLNKIPIIIVMLVLLAFVIIVGLAASQRGKDSIKAELPSGYNTENRAKTLLSDLPDGYVQPEPKKTISLDNPPMPDTQAINLPPEPPIDGVLIAIMNDRNSTAFQALKAKSTVPLSDLTRQYQQAGQNVEEKKSVVPLSSGAGQSTNDILASIQQAIDTADDLTEANKVYQEMLAKQQKGNK